MEPVDPYIIQSDGTAEAAAVQRALEAIVRSLADIERRLAAAGIP